MLFLKLISHKYKESTRSNFWQKQLILNIIIGFFVLILLSYLLMLGLFLNSILETKFPNENPVTIFNGFLLYYFIAELVLRLMLQNLPIVNIESYLHLPIKKNNVIHYLNFRSLFVVGNYLTLAVFIPFAFKVISPSYGIFPAIIWITSLIFLSFANNYWALFIKRQFVNKPISTFIIGILLVALIFFDYFNVFSLTQISQLIFNKLILNPVAIFTPIFLLLISYFINFFYLKVKLYPENFTNRIIAATDSSKTYKYLKQYGHIGQLIINDIKLIWRHKRTRSLTYMAPLFLCYGLIIYRNDYYLNNNGFLIFVGVFMIGGMMLNYLNYAFSYESGHFDFILAYYTDTNQYLKQKYLFGVAISVISYVLTIPYVLFGAKILFINTMTFFYNIGVLSYLLLYFATFSKKRMDLGKSAAFNYQGMGIGHWISILPFFILPLIIYWPFSVIQKPIAGFIVIGCLGLIGLALNKQIIKLIEKQLQNKKYSMAEGFRSD